MKKILMYGSSLWFDGLTTNMFSTPECQIVRAKRLQDLQMGMSEIDLVIMDAMQAADVLAVLTLCPAAVVLSVDLVTNQMTILQSQTAEVKTMQEIVQIARGIIATRPGLKMVMSTATH